METNRKRIANKENNIGLIQTHDEEEEENAKRFLPLFGKIFGIEMPHLNKLSMLKWLVTMGLWAATLIFSFIVTILMAIPLMTDYLQYRTTSTLTKRLIALNITTDELQQTLGRALGTRLKLDVSLQQTTTYAPIGKGGTTLQNIDYKQMTTNYLGFYWVCYTLDFASLNITIQSTVAAQFVQIQMDGSNLNYDPYAGSNDFDLTLMILVDLKNRLNVPVLAQTVDTADNMMQGIFGTTRKYAISVSAVYRAMHIKNNTVQCVELNTLDLCRWECRSKLIYKVCGCNAVTLPKNAWQNGSDCSLAEYIKCNFTFDMSDEENCIDSCQKPCEQWKFDCQLIENFGIPWPTPYLLGITYNPQHSYTATIQLTVTNFDYPLFEEQYVWTLEGFIGSLGGVMGLFLGLDATILLQVFLYIFSVVGSTSVAIRQIRKKKIEITTPLDANLRTVVVIPK